MSEEIKLYTIQILKNVGMAQLSCIVLVFLKDTLWSVNDVASRDPLEIRQCSVQ